MKANLDCIPCFLNQSLEAARMATDDEELHERVMKEVMAHLQNVSFSRSPPEISMGVHDIIRKITGSDDPYRKVKDKSNEMAKKLYPGMKEMVRNAEEPLLMAIKLSIVGNVIDFGTANRFNVEEMIEKAAEKELGGEYEEFKNALATSKSILYIADNAGEVFFDKLLIEKLAEMGKEIVYAVRANAIINDATKKDAEFAGIDEFAKIIAGDEGQEKSSPGMLLLNASPDFMEYFENSDMVISKGQGNYESLSDVERSIVFLLMVKCPLVAKDIGIEVGTPVLKVKK